MFRVRRHSHHCKSADRFRPAQRRPCDLGELDALVGHAVADPVLVSGGAEAAGPVEIRRNLSTADAAAAVAELGAAARELP
jgi:hypothetical protein